MIEVQPSQLAASRVLIAGDAMLDRYWFGDAERISPEAPVPVVRVVRTQDRLGGASNVANNIAGVGGTPTLLSIVGDDDAGRMIEHLAANCGIEPRLVVDPGHRTILKLRILARQQQMLRCDFESAPSPDALERYLEIFKSILPDHRALILSDYGKGGLAHITPMIEQAEKLGIPVLVDPKGSDYSRYVGATAITPNRAELAQVVGSWTSESDLIERAQNLRKELRLKYLLLTRSEEGMTLFSENGVLNVPAQAREVYDVSGAGDTVIAILAVMLAAGFTIEEAVRTANRAGGIVVGKLGTATVSFDELFHSKD